MRARPACRWSAKRPLRQSDAGSEFIREDEIVGTAELEPVRLPNGQVGALAGRELPDVVAAEHGCAATCAEPQGLTRTGMPERIVQLPNQIILFYAGNATSPRDFRMIPTDGRMHTKGDLEAVTFWGRSVGRWDGDTLVIDSVGFNDLTWLARGGLFHSEKLHIIERFRREGDVLHYAVTVEDPEVLLEPWVLPESESSLNANPNAGIIAESEPCSEYEAEELAAGSHIRH
jgi:hypothetical protein